MRLFVQVANYGAFHKIKWKSPWARYRHYLSSGTHHVSLSVIFFHHGSADAKKRISPEPMRYDDVRIFHNTDYAKKIP